MDFRNWIPWLWGLEDPAHDGKLVGIDPGRASFAQEPKAVWEAEFFLAQGKSDLLQGSFILCKVICVTKVHPASLLLSSQKLSRRA